MPDHLISLDLVKRIMPDGRLQLRELVAAGVLTRRDHQRVPPMVDCTMTPFGLTLAAALMPLCEWATRIARSWNA